MSRIEGRLTAADDAALDMAELLQLLDPGAATSPGERVDAIARYLSLSEGWREARSSLKGTFAALSKPTELTRGKE